MSKIIAITNHKGGVGKTTTTLNLASGCQQIGKKVLCLDLDPQANLSQSVKIHHPRNIYTALKSGEPLLPFTILQGWDIVPSTLDLSGAEIELSGEAGREYLLKELLQPIKDTYDLIFIDCPPALGLLTLNALTASDYLIIPVQCEYLALQGLAKLLEVIEKIKKRLNPSLTIIGILLTQYDGRKILNRQVEETLVESFGDKVFKTKIRDNIALAEAPVQGLDIFRYDSKSRGSEDYFLLCNELLNRLV
jgi:chromosome partitioning protein